MSTIHGWNNILLLCVSSISWPAITLPVAIKQESMGRIFFSFFIMVYTQLDALELLTPTYFHMLVSMQFSVYKLLSPYNSQHIYTLSYWLLQYVGFTFFFLISHSFSQSPFFCCEILSSFLFFLSISFPWCVWVVSSNRWPMTGSGLARASSYPSFLCFYKSKILPAVIWHVCGLDGCCCFLNQVSKCTVTNLQFHPFLILSLTATFPAFFFSVMNKKRE